MNDDCPRCAGIGFKHAQCPSCKTGPWEVSDVTRQLIERDQHGRQKYGVTLDRTDLSHADWLQHMAEELMDGAGYALAAKREYERMQQGVGVPPMSPAGYRVQGPVVPPMSPAGYRVQGLGFDHATGGFVSVRIDGVTFAAQLVARRMMQTPQQVPTDGEAVAWRWHHPEGDSGSWQDRDPPREQSWRDDEGCTIEYAYAATPQAPKSELPKSAEIGSKSVDGDAARALESVAESLCELEVCARNASRATGIGGIEGDDLRGLRSAFGRLADSLETQQNVILETLAAYSANTAIAAQGEAGSA